MNISKLKKGISLIVLIITIVVILILTTTVILTLQDDGTVSKAKEAVLREDILTFQTELKSYIDNKKFDAITNGEYYSSTDDDLLNNNTQVTQIKKVIPSFSSKYEDVFAIKNGSLYYISENRNEETLKVLNDLGVKYENIY